MVDLHSRVQYLKGVGPRKAKAFRDVGIETVADLLLYLPFRYEDRSRRRKVAELAPGQETTVLVEVVGVRLKRTRRRGFTVLEVLFEDDSGRLQGIWFNQEFLKDTFRVGRRAVLYGKVEPQAPGQLGWLLQMKNPQYELVDGEETDTVHTGRIVPIYQRVGPLSTRMLRRILRTVVEGLPSELPELLPESVRRRHRLPTRRQALERAHFPEEGAPLEDYSRFRSPAQLHLILEELFHLYLAFGLRRRADAARQKPRSFPVDDRIREIARRMLPFRLTEAQRRVVKTIADDLGSHRPMRRLVQGDVGSGKTIVAVLASIIVMENRAQVAFMVPTELLAEQHFLNIRRLLQPLGYRVALLSSRLKRSERDALWASIERGEVNLVVGTHALIQGEVTFKELGLAIIDEQHRFGVLQRADLRRKGEGADLLVMTATPIPRSLAMTLYGNLDTSIIDELPPGRKPVRTAIHNGDQFSEVYRLVEAQIRAGRQVYYVCPLIEESEKSDLRAAVETHRRLARGPFAHRRVALLHGRMPSAEREETMRAFWEGRIDLLVATTVIEVGVDVPNATLMVIDHAERFGLAQLHQLRGRVGRGAEASTAILIPHPPLTPEAERRLEAMVETNDGFVIAERDLEIRGPGDYFGTRQSGVPLFRVADVVRDADLMDTVRSEALSFLSSGADATPEGQRIVGHVFSVWGNRLGLVAAG